MNFYFLGMMVSYKVIVSESSRFTNLVHASLDWNKIWDELLDITGRPRPRKKRDFSWQKPWGHFLKPVISCDFFPEQKDREKRGNFTKSVIYRDQKSKKLPNDRHNERAVVRILIENGAKN